ncbi:hypothetical protein CAI21_20955 [Alkalilimnicola ehrlichii]|uniref:Exo-alpha-sialidase n=2 Tax=Alkalilimnicola ehrlichii TaxID=351052 RepID=A0A3E0WG73_9GAMM|nr:hypothetical protein CAI21_20955 [Alkalilimnicola ehrlichii]RFA31728.1 hypothetical protein CAL65_21595 [Alkalilimnicola ehrlichii]
MSLILLIVSIALTGCGKPAPEESTRFSYTGEQDVVSLGVARSKDYLHVVWVEAHDPPQAFHSRSRDGRTWSDPVAIDTEQAPPDRSSRSNDIRIAAHDESLVVVWQTQGEGFRGSGPMVLARSSDGGQTWHAAEPPATTSAAPSHGFFALSATSGGEFHLAWLDNRHGQQGLHHAHSKDGLDWSAVTTIESITCQCCWNTLAHGERHHYVLYRGIAPRDMHLAVQPHDGNWRTTAAVGAFGWDINGCPHVGGGLVASDDALHALVWTGSEAYQGVHYTRGKPDGTGWQEQARVAAKEAGNPDLSLRGGGGLTAVWDQNGAAAGIYVAWIENDRFSRALRLSDRPQARLPLALPVDTGAAVFWTERGSNGRLGWVVSVVEGSK